MEQQIRGGGVIARLSFLLWLRSSYGSTLSLGLLIFRWDPSSGAQRYFHPVFHCCFSHCSGSRMTGVRPSLLGGLLVLPVRQSAASVSVYFMLRGGNLVVWV